MSYDQHIIDADNIAFKHLHEGKMTIVAAQMSPDTLPTIRGLGDVGVILCLPDVKELIDDAVAKLSLAAQVAVIPVARNLLDKLHTGELVISSVLPDETIIMSTPEGGVRKVEENFKAAMACLEKQEYDEAYEKAKMRDYNKPPKEEVRYKHQQDRYRQRHHSKFHRK